MPIDTFIQKPKGDLISHSTLKHPQRRKGQEEVGERGPEEQRALLEGALECIDGPHTFS